MGSGAGAGAGAGAGPRQNDLSHSWGGPCQNLDDVRSKPSIHLPFSGTFDRRSFDDTIVHPTMDIYHLDNHNVPSTIENDISTFLRLSYRSIFKEGLKINIYR